MDHFYVAVPFQFTHGARRMRAIIGTRAFAGVRMTAHHRLTRRPAVAAEDMADFFSGAGDEFGARIRLNCCRHGSISLIRSPRVP